MEDVIYAEEISHCAAGVRWLRHLHAVAHSMQPGRGANGSGSGSGSGSAPGSGSGASGPEASRSLESSLQGLALGSAAEGCRGAAAAAAESCGASGGNARACAACASGAACEAGCASNSGGGGEAGAAAETCCAEGEGGEAGLPEWAAEARRHPTVEAFFHSLIRAHFRWAASRPAVDASSVPVLILLDLLSAPSQPTLPLLCARWGRAGRAASLGRCSRQPAKKGSKSAMGCHRPPACVPPTRLSARSLCHRGPLKPPFNHEARAKAGFGPEWYLPLAEAEPDGAPAAAAAASGKE